jgi:hypothetical protein
MILRGKREELSRIIEEDDKTSAEQLKKLDRVGFDVIVLKAQILSSRIKLIYIHRHMS